MGVSIWPPPNVVPVSYTHLDVYKRQLQSIANSQDSTGDYVFAGYRSNTQPFVGSMAGGITYQGDQGARTLQTSSSRNLPITSSGEEIFNRIRAPIGSGFALSAACLLYTSRCV